MGCPRTLVEQWPFRIWVGAAQVWDPAGPSFVIAGASGIDSVVTVTKITGNVRVIPAAQLIDARDESPGTPTAATGSWTASATSTHNTTSLTTVTDKYRCRIGLLAELSGGTTQGWVEGFLSATVAQCAARVGERAVEVAASQNTAAPSTYPIGRVAASSASLLRAAIVATDVKDVEYAFLVRGVNDPDAPGAWVALNAGAYTSLTDGNTATCYADQSVSGVTPANYHWLDVAIRLRMKAAGANPTGTLRVSASMSYT